MLLEARAEKAEKAGQKKLVQQAIAAYTTYARKSDNTKWKKKAEERVAALKRNMRKKGK